MDFGGQQVAIERVFKTESQIACVAPEVAAIIVKITYDIWSLLRTSPAFTTRTASLPIRRAMTRFFTAQNSLGGLLDDILGFYQLVEDICSFI